MATPKTFSSMINPDTAILSYPDRADKHSILDLFKEEESYAFTADSLCTNLGIDPHDHPGIKDSLSKHSCEALPDPLYPDQSKLGYTVTQIDKMTLNFLIPSRVNRALARGLSVNKDAQTQTAAALFFLVDWAASLDQVTFNQLPQQAVKNLYELHNFVDQYREKNYALYKIAYLLEQKTDAKNLKMSQKLSALLAPAQGDMVVSSKLQTDESQRPARIMAERFLDYPHNSDFLREEDIIKFQQQVGSGSPTAEAVQACLDGLYDAQVYYQWKVKVDDNPNGVQEQAKKLANNVIEFVMPFLEKAIPATFPVDRETVEDAVGGAMKTVQSYGYDWKDRVKHVSSNFPEDTKQSYEQACERVFSLSRAVTDGTKGLAATVGVGKASIDQYYLNGSQIQGFIDQGVTRATNFLGKAARAIDKESKKAGLDSQKNCLSYVNMMLTVAKGLQSYQTQVSKTCAAQVEKATASAEQYCQQVLGAESHLADKPFQVLKEQIKKIKSENQYNAIVERVLALRQEIAKKPLDLSEITKKTTGLIQDIQEAKKKTVIFPFTFLQYWIGKLFSGKPAQDLTFRRGLKRTIQELTAKLPAVREKIVQSSKSSPARTLDREINQKNNRPRQRK